MKKIFSICLICLVATSAAAQNDSIINRVVTVEREFQPVIESAGKISVTPQIYEAKAPEAKVVYSDYSNPLQTDFNTNPLDFAQVTIGSPSPLHGFLRGAIGHSATRFDFNYRVGDKKDLYLDLHANHLGQWGRKTLSNSKLGFDFSKRFNQTEFFFGADGKNIYFTRYSKYFEYNDLYKMTGDFVNLSDYSNFAPDDKTNHWDIRTRIGVQSLPNQTIQYKVQTGYEAFIMGKELTEHTINTHGMLDWHSSVHHAGADLQIQNHIYSADLTGFAWSDRNIERGDTYARNYHALKIEPYYAYEGERIDVHAGVNLDFCFGKGQGFLPSPNVTFEAKLVKDWLALYGGAVGDYQTSSVREHFEHLRYLHPENEIATTQNRSYIPIDAFAGFKIRPHANLLIDLYAHYKLTKYQVYAVPDSVMRGYFNLVGGDNYEWKFGGKINYHYKDIINISLNGFYALGKMLDDTNQLYQVPDGHILHKPTWGVTFRIDAKVNSKISFYTDNYFGGGQYALDYTYTAVQLKPVVDLNLGAQYNIDKWLSCYLQLNNYLNRKHDIFYGYQSQGINFLAGVSWSF